MPVRKRLILSEKHSDKFKLVYVDGLSEETIDKLASIININADDCCSAETSYQIKLLGKKIDVPIGMGKSHIREEFIRVLEELDKN